MSLSTMPPELLLSIFAPLDFEDLVCLLPTCKHIRRTAFYCLRKIVDERTVASISEFQSMETEKTATVPMEDLQVLRSSEYDQSRGLHIVFTVVDEDNKTSTETSVYDMNDFLDIVSIGIKSGKMDILNGVLYISEPVSSDLRFFKLFIALKQYSRIRSPVEFSITSLSSRLSPANMVRLFDTDKLTKLTIFTNKRVRGGSDDERIFEDIEDFRALFERVCNLEELEILLSSPVGLGTNISPPGIHPPGWKELKTAFLGLKKLHTFKLDAFLFYSCYFLPIPESVRTLSYAHVAYYSRQWWTQFAEYPFKNVESLDLSLCGTRECFEQGGLGTHLSPNWPSEGTSDHLLRDVEIRGLKEFTCQKTQIPYLPADLVMCILSRNSGLSKDTRQRFAQEYSMILIQRCKEELIQAMAHRMYEIEVSNKMEQRYLENGPQADDLEKCALDYLSKFSGFLTRPVGETAATKATEREGSAS
ncbi:hypothetical protein TWF730_005315 [Orbilia blumenaviensis]|uniref:F-box domain-containing protein n=1 Tax=Orbilia blumenaviensis TaxID=1796055 RepID=A0AAV9VP65_9PEZI